MKANNFFLFILTDIAEKLVESNFVLKKISKTNVFFSNKKKS